MGVEVHLAVGRVDEAVQALPSMLIGQLGGDDDEVLAVSVESVQLNTRSVVFRLDFLAVDDDRFDLAVEQVQEGVGLRGGEPHSGVGGEVGGAISVSTAYVDTDVVPLDFDDLRPVTGFLAGQIHRTHTTRVWQWRMP